MIVKYCNICPGRPYTTNLQVQTCPKCGSTLGMESVDESQLEGREQLRIPTSSAPGSEQTFPCGRGDGTEQNVTPQNKAAPRRNGEGNLAPAGENRIAIPTSRNIDTENIGTFVPEKTIRGRILQYSSSGKEDGQYRRLFPVRLFQALFYHQRLEDVLHRFTVRVDRGRDALGHDAYTDIPVNVHGTVSGGMQLNDNAEVEVRGKYCDGVLMASEIYIINNGYSSKVRFQRSVSAIINSILLTIMACVICYIGASSGNFFESILQFCKVWGIAAVIFCVLYLIANLSKIGILVNMMSKKEKKFPFMGILVVSFTCAFLFIAAFGSIAGFGSYLSGLAMSILPVVIIIIAAFFLLKALIGV